MTILHDPTLLVIATKNAQTLSTGSYTVLDFNIVKSDVQGCLTTGGACKYVAKSAGFYLAHLSIGIDGVLDANQKASVGFTKNGTSDPTAGDYSNTYSQVTNAYIYSHFTGIFWLEIGDYLSPMGFQNSGGNGDTLAAGATLVIVPLGTRR